MKYEIVNLNRTENKITFSVRTKRGLKYKYQNGIF